MSFILFLSLPPFAPPLDFNRCLSFPFKTYLARHDTLLVASTERIEYRVHNQKKRAWVPTDISIVIIIVTEGRVAYAA